MTSSKSPKTISVLPEGANKEIRKSVAVSAALLMAATAPLVACSDASDASQRSTPSASSAWSEPQVSQEDRSQSRMVRGREECIRELQKSGNSAQQAAEICDKAFADAMAQQAARSGTSSQAVASSGGGFDASDALLWYFLLSNNNSHAPQVYRRDERPVSAGGGGFAYVGGTSTAGYRPQLAYSAAQGSYLSQPPAQRIAAAQQQAAAARAAQSAPKPSTGATSRGGFSSSASPGGG